MARESGKSQNEVDQISKKCLDKLKTARATRPRPHIDDKILVAWNAMMISTLCDLYRAIPNESNSYLDLARHCFSFIRSKMQPDGPGTLRRSYRKDSVSEIRGFSEDYAYLTKAAFDLYECTLDVEYLEEAIRLYESQDELFWDDISGGFYGSSAALGHLDILRQKPLHDGATLSVNSISLGNMIKLNKICESKEVGPDSLKNALNNLDPDKLKKKTLKQLQLNLRMTQQLPNALAGSLSTAIFLYTYPITYHVRKSSTLYEKLNGNFCPFKMVIGGTGDDIQACRDMTCNLLS